MQLGMLSMAEWTTMLGFWVLSRVLSVFKESRLKHKTNILRKQVCIQWSSLPKKNHENRTWIIDTFITTFITNNFISNIRLKLTKNQAKAEQHPEPELLLFDNCLLSSWTLSSKIGHILNNVQWNRCVYFQD